MHGYWAYDWANSYERVAELNPDRHFIRTTPPYGHYGFRKGQRFKFLNVLEELDQPGEWFIDRKKGALYFWPPQTETKEKSAKPEAILSLLNQPLLKMTEASHIVVRGFVLEATRANAVEIRGGTSNLVAGCLIRNIGDTGVVIEGGTGHGVTACDIFDTGDGGVSLNGGDRQTLAPGGHFVENCHFQRQGRWSKCYVPAVLMDGVGQRASHNLIHDHPHAAILFSGNDHLIEFNEIHHIALETGDVGAIYMPDAITPSAEIAFATITFTKPGGVGHGLDGRLHGRLRQRHRSLRQHLLQSSLGDVHRRRSRPSRGEQSFR